MKNKKPFDKYDKYKRTPLHYVCIDHPKDDWVAIASKLISDGYDVNAQDKNGWAPLHFAAQEGSIEVTKLLIKSGANIHIKNDNGNTPLWVATMNSRHGNELIDLLVHYGSNPNEKNYHDVSPMDIEPNLFKKNT